MVNQITLAGFFIFGMSGTEPTPSLNLHDPIACHYEVSVETVVI